MSLKIRQLFRSVNLSNGKKAELRQAIPMQQEARSHHTEATGKKLKNLYTITGEFLFFKEYTAFSPLIEKAETIAVNI